VACQGEGVKSASQAEAPPTFSPQSVDIWIVLQVFSCLVVSWKAEDFLQPPEG
jgi:hypothetical protein